MPTKNKRIHITPSPEFLKWLERKKMLGGYYSLAEVLLNLAEPAIRKAGFEGPLMLERGKYLREDESWTKELTPEEKGQYDDGRPENGIW